MVVMEKLSRKRILEETHSREKKELEENFKITSSCS